MRKLIAIVLCLALTPLGAFAAEGETLESLKEKAVAASVDLLAMEQGMESLMENLDAVQDREEEIEAAYEAYQTYERLHRAGAGLIPDPNPLDPLDPLNPTPEQIAMKQAYLELQAMFLKLFDIQTPSFNDEQIYDNFIYPVDVLPNKLMDQYASLRIDRERVTSMLEGGVEALWWNMGSLGTQQKLIEEYVSLLQVQLGAETSRFEVGRISELQLEAKRLDLDIAMRDQIRLDREGENLDYRMRSIAGLEFEEPFSVRLLPVTETNGEMKTYEALLTESLRSRADAIRALRQVYSIRQEIDVMEDVIDDDDHPRRKAIRMELLRAEEAYEATVRSVDAQLYAAFDAALTKKEALLNARSTYDISVLDLNRVKALHSVGYVADVDLIGAEMGQKQALFALESSIYQYNLAYQTLIRTVRYGSGTGGMAQ